MGNPTEQAIQSAIIMTLAQMLAANFEPETPWAEMDQATQDRYRDTVAWFSDRFHMIQKQPGDPEHPENGANHAGDENTPHADPFDPSSFISKIKAEVERIFGDQDLKRFAEKALHALLMNRVKGSNADLAGTAFDMAEAMMEEYAFRKSAQAEPAAAPEAAAA